MASALSNRQTVDVHAKNKTKKKKKTLQAQPERTLGAGCMGPWPCTAEPLGERHYENYITTSTVKYYTETVLSKCMNVTKLPAYGPLLLKELIYDLHLRTYGHRLKQLFKAEGIESADIAPFEGKKALTPKAHGHFRVSK